MKKASFITILILSIGLFVTSCSVTLEGKINDLADDISSDLELNSSQKMILDGIKLDLISDFQERRAYSYVRNPMVERFLTAEKLDRASVDAALKMRHKSLVSKVNQYFPKFEELHGSLSPEQKQKLSKSYTKYYKKFRSF